MKTPSERERKILKLVVEDYIETATPVPSRRLKEKFHISVSPATIRNILHTLEDAGLLDHLHVSSGRIPTDSGYRFYVDRLMGVAQESASLKTRIMEELSAMALNVDEILQIAANSLANISSLFGFAFLESSRDAPLTDLELVSLSSGRLLLVLGFKSHDIKTVVLDLSVDVRESHVDTVSSVLQERLLGLTIREIQESIDERLKNEDIFNSEIVQVIVHNAETYFSVSDTHHVRTSQKDLLLRHPEFNQLEQMQSIVSVLDDEASLVRSMSSLVANLETWTFIGKENRETAFRSCSVVTNEFVYGDTQGRLGIIGPTRMSYRDVFTLVNTFGSAIHQIAP